MVRNQAYLFIVFSLTGIAIGLLFDIFRASRKNIKINDIIIYIEDILFWILSGFIVLYNIWYFNDGEIRLFMFLGIILGVLIYMLILSNLIINILTWIISPIVKLVKFCKKKIIFLFKRGKMQKKGE